MATIEKNARLAEAGRKGGLAGGHKGGVNRMASLSDEQRTALAKAAAAVRWADPIQIEVIRKAKQMLEQIAVDGKPQKFYFDGKRAWHAPFGYLHERLWAPHWLKNCTTTTTLAEIVEEALSCST